MSDQEQLSRLLCAGHSCVSILTFEEAEALDTVRATAVDVGVELMQWSVLSGLHDGLAAASPTVTGTEHPAAALLFPVDAVPPDRGRHARPRCASEG